MTIVLAILYTKYEAAATSLAMCITLFLFVNEAHLERSMTENFQIPLLPIWVILTMWLLYGTEAPENHFHSLGEMTVRDLMWVALIVASFPKGMDGNSRSILRVSTMALVAVSLFLPTEGSVATLMPPWVIFSKAGLCILLYVTFQIKERVRPRGELKGSTDILHEVVFQCLSPLFLYPGFLVVPCGLLVYGIWTTLDMARKRASRVVDPAYVAPPFEPAQPPLVVGDEDDDDEDYATGSSGFQTGTDMGNAAAEWINSYYTAPAHGRATPKHTSGRLTWGIIEDGR